MAINNSKAYRNVKFSAPRKTASPIKLMLFALRSKYSSFVFISNNSLGTEDKRLLVIVLQPYNFE